MTDIIHICSLNCQGLGSKDKRQRLYLWMSNQNCNILFVQESHFTGNQQNLLNEEFKGQIYHSFGTTQSRGVSIFIKEEINCKFIDKFQDEEGRLILINIEINDTIYTLVNIYAPNIPKKRNNFFKKVKKIIEKNSIGMIIVGGDMNDVLSNIDSKSCGKNNKNKKPVNNLKILIRTQKLNDIWRELHKDEVQFTWRRKNNIQEATRIDFFLICPEIRPLIESSDIRPAIISHTDHQAISLKLKGKIQNRGRGYFKINNSILENREYKNIIQKLIQVYRDKLILTNDIRVLWDLFKTEVREHTVAFCKRNAKKHENEINILEKK